MLFSSITFLYYFLPIVLAVYFLAPRRGKNLVLLLASLVFYWWGEPRYVFLMLFTIAFAYVCGLLIGRFRGRGAAKGFLILSVAGELAVLGYFKYADFFLSTVHAALKTELSLLSIALPIGISFYTFQTLSYTVDVYRGTVAPQRSFLKLATYIAMFPQLIAGPIVRYRAVEGTLTERHTTAEDLGQGLSRFVLGLSKKVLLANQLGAFAAALQGSGEQTVLLAWLAAIAFALQIYFDFSGYSDMAIGLGRVLGFRFLENFNYPLIARSATEFWRRWHISLGSWFRDYVYIPLGGSRKGRARQLFNILIVWLLTGLWHGAAGNFVLWGLFFAALLVLEKLFLLRVLEHLPRAVGHGYLLFAAVIGFAVFNADGLPGATADLSCMFGLSGVPFAGTQTMYYLSSYGLLLLLAVVGATPLPGRVAARCAQCRGMTILQPAVLLVLLLVCTADLVDGSFNPFLYVRF